MGNTSCRVRFLKQVDFSGSFPQGSHSAAPHPPTLTAKGSTRLPRLQGEPVPCAELSREARPWVGQGEAFQPGIPCGRAGTRQGATEHIPRLSALMETVQRAQSPFPALPGAVARPGLSQAWPLCRADVQPTREGLRACCLLGMAVVSSLCITHVHEPILPPCCPQMFADSRKEGEAPRHCRAAPALQLSGQAIIFDWRKGKFLGSLHQPSSRHGSWGTPSTLGHTASTTGLHQHPDCPWDARHCSSRDPCSW